MSTAYSNVDKKLEKNASKFVSIFLSVINNIKYFLFPI